MENQDILSRVVNILENRLKVNKNLLKEENYLQPLTGTKFRFTALELTYLFYMVEKEFECKIDVNLIRNYEFNTIAGIAEIISKAEAQ